MAKLKDIAQKTNFSVTTVSRALGGYDDVSEETRQTILSVARELGYEPNLVARQLQSQRTDTIGIIAPMEEVYVSDGYFRELLISLGSAASRKGFDLLFSAHSSFSNEMQAYRKFVGGNRVDGMVIVRTRKDDPRIDYLTRQGCPFVVQGRLEPDVEELFPYVDLDNRKGVYLLTEHLLQQGHKQIAIILPPIDLAFTEYRLRGYRDALQAYHLSLDEKHIFYGDLGQHNGYSITQRIIQHLPYVTAIVACNDLMALGAIQAIQEANMRVGSDIAVVGFDDIPAARLSRPSLTTIHQPINDIGTHLVDILVSHIDGTASEAAQMLLAPQLIVRDSTR